MWPFSSVPTKAELLDIKTVRVGTGVYRIKKVNPLLDFTAANMPQIFAYFQSRRKQDKESITEEQAKRAQSDMYAVIQAGVVEPKLVPIGQGDARGKEDGITVEDIFRIPENGIKLYWEILIHSLNRFSGLRGVFFSARTRFALRMQLRKDTAKLLAALSLETASV